MFQWKSHNTKFSQIPDARNGLKDEHDLPIMPSLHRHKKNKFLLMFAAFTTSDGNDVIWVARKAHLRQ
jgi:hypothetical protein